MTKKIRLKISQRLYKKKNRRNTSTGVRSCRFCQNIDQKNLIDYKNSTFLRSFLTERGKILPSRISGVCCKHQRGLAKEIRKSRTIALLPYSAHSFQ
ncbi:30S ribosomal protein S18 [bacterium]|nr:MAG: 30S ribosomal protein S18 [bacterium]QQR62221.1 MAG: 30S ribosomal protein S18 [bacterium]QQR63217.1 MAG: 30S ribosomal protein S18 [bacterium]